MKIWKKILLGFISVILIMMFVDIYALRNNIDIIRKIDNLEISKRVELSQSNKTKYLLQEIDLNIKELFLEMELENENREILESKRIIGESIPKIDESLTKLAIATKTGYDLAETEDESAREKEELQYVDSLTELTENFFISLQKIQNILDGGKLNKAKDLYEEETELLVNDARKLLTVMSVNSEEEVAWAIKELNEKVDRTLQLGIYLTILSILLAISIGLYIAKTISDPLNKIIEGTNQIRKGNLKTKVRLKTKGELQLLANSFNKMAIELYKQASSSKKLNNELIESNKSKDTFFSVIAHDLRNPFNVILGLADLLNTQYDSFDEDERKKVINEINNASKLTYELLENLLNWARSQTGKIKIIKENLNLKMLADRSIESYALNAEQKNITIHNNIQDKTNIYADHYTLTVIINNILNNAIKFTNKDGNIFFSAISENGNVELTIKDTGIGMSKEIIKSLSANTYISSNIGTNKEKGTGLGLTLIKEFTEKNDGKISIISNPGEGTEFKISFPYNETAG